MNVDGPNRFINQSNSFVCIRVLLKSLSHESSCKAADTQKKRKVNAILSKESHNMSIECKTLSVYGMQL